MATLKFPGADDVAAIRLPDKLSDPGLLVGWSLGHRHPTRPIGFTYGDPLQTPSTGFVDPIQLAQEGHLITIAPTGAGKGRGCIVPALLLHQGPVIVIDPKGENTAITARRRREMGQQVIVLDPMSVTDEPASAFNPLDMIDIDSAVAVDDISMLVQSFWGASVVDPHDRFWLSRGQQVIIGLLIHLLADYPADQRNFGGLRRLVAKAVGDPQAMFLELSRSRHEEARLIATSLSVPATETLGGIMAFCQDLIDFLRGPLVRQATATSSFDVNSITRGDPLTIYLVLPPHMLESHGRLLRIWISAMLNAITRRRAKAARSTLFILDEAAQLGALAQLRQAITLLRGYGLQTWSFWQDVSQLRMLYPNDWQTMLNNCRVLQCFGALNMNAATDMAELTGIGTGDAVLELKPDEMLLQLAGDSAVVARLPDYLRDPPFAGAFDANPYYQHERAIMATPVRSIQLRPPDASPVTPPPSPKAPAVTGPDPLHERLLALWA